ncbi:MAG: mechanosensitive ion channel family protein [Microbacteriaceae bacterium]|nr:mechanosensitive ion channel family protein [Microbacteriaceae bacterium]MCL2795228.1 mechanosensitive ion channel family protein [Microbacteriaceae bacterium]
MSIASHPTETISAVTTSGWDDFVKGWDQFFAHQPGILIGKAAQVVIIALCAILAAWLLRIAIKHIVHRIVTTVKKAQGVETTQALQVSPVATIRVVQRTRTLGSVLSNIANVTITVIALMLILSVMAPNVLGSLALLSAAVGAGLGFGAQNVVGDVFNGLLMVMEDQLGVGDIVEAGMVSLATDGVVEAVGIRTTQIRDVNGTLWYVRNGQILRIGNMSQGWARVLVDVAVGYDNDVDAVQAKLLETAESLARDPKWRVRIIERPEIWGIQSIAADMIVLRVAMKVRSTARDDVAHELNARIFQTVRDEGVTTPALTNPILTGFQNISSVNGAHPPRTRPLPTVAEQPAKPKRTRTPRRKPGTPEGSADE